MLVSRVTNSMLKNTLLSNLGMNLTRMDKLQNQMSTGRKFGEISDDPAALVFGQSARNKIARLTQYHESVGTARSWLTQAEAGVMELNKVVGAVYEELVSAGGVKTPEDKRILGMAVEQFKNHYVDTLNTAFGDRFVFAGYNTPGDFAHQKETVIKPFTIEYHPRVALEPPDRVGRLEPQLHFNGFNLSQFDGMPSSLLSLNVANGVPTPEAALDAHLLTLNNPDGTPLFPGGLDGGPPGEDFISKFGFSTAADAVEALITKQALKDDVKSLDVGPGITMPITMNGIDMLFYSARTTDGVPIMRNTFDMLFEVYIGISGSPAQGDDPGDPLAVPPRSAVTAMDRSEPKFTDDLTLLIKLVQDSQNHILTKTAEIGGRQRRLDLLEARYDTDLINYEQMRSDAEDADMAEVIMNLKMAEVVYQAALSAGARIIQPTLMDFLR